MNGKRNATSWAHGPALTALVDQFPDPKWDDETSRKTYEKLIQRIERRESVRRIATRAAVAVGTAVAAAAAFLLLQ